MKRLSSSDHPLPHSKLRLCVSVSVIRLIQPIVLKTFYFCLFYKLNRFVWEETWSKQPAAVTCEITRLRWKRWRANAKETAQDTQREIVRKLCLGVEFDYCCPREIARGNLPTKFNNLMVSLAVLPYRRILLLSG